MGGFKALLNMIYSHRLFTYFGHFILSAILCVQFLGSKLNSVYNILMGVGIGLAFISIVLGPTKNNLFKLKTLFLLSLIPILYIVSACLHHDFDPDTLKNINLKLYWIYFPFIFCFVKKGNSREEKILLYVYISAVLVFLISQILPYVYEMYTNPAYEAFHFFNFGSTYNIQIPHHFMTIIFTFGIIAILILYEITSQRSLLFNFAILVLILIILCSIYLTGARVGILTSSLVLTIYLVLKITQGNKSIILPAMVILVIFISFGYYLYHSSDIIRYRVNETIKEIKYLANINFDSSIEERGNFTVRIIDLIYYSDILYKNPIIGATGPSQTKYKLALDEIHKNKHSEGWVYKLIPANVWFRVAAQLGFPIAIMIFILIFVPLLTERGKKSIFLVMFLLVLFIFSNTEDSFDSRIPFYIIITTYSFFLRINTSLLNNQ
jgi:hypothetical protein